MLVLSSRYGSPWLLALACAALLAAPACGGGDDDGGGGDGDGVGDGLPLPDGGFLPDATPEAQGGMGQPCTGEGQGNCPTGFTCQNLQGGAWCSKECEPGTAGNNFCNGDYDGPGISLCLFGVDNTGDEMADYFICGVLCEDTSIGQCDAETCDGSCPYEQTCTAPVRDGEGATVGGACTGG